MNVTENFTKIEVATLLENPSILPILRMATAPPIARDRLVGLTGVRPSFVDSMEQQQKISPRMDEEQVKDELSKICLLVEKLLDPEIFPWKSGDIPPSQEEIRRAATVVADRRCSAVADPLIRNAQERRQLFSIQSWLENRGYSLLENFKDSADLKPGKFSFRANIRVKLNETKEVNAPIDVVVRPLGEESTTLPILIEAKSAGDFTNTNKRRKEEAMKVAQLRATYGSDIRFLLFLCGFFDSGYLGYEAAEGIDWVWEHRIDDLEELGL